MPIHSTAIISLDANIGANVDIGPYSIVHSNVIIGDNCTVGSHCEIGVPTSLGDSSPLIIGSDSIIRSHSVFYESSVFGPKLVTGHRVTVREKTYAGNDFQIGTGGEIQGHCSIGNYVKFQSSVIVGKYTDIEDFVWVFPYVVFTNDPHPPSDVMKGPKIKKYAAIATMSTIFPGVTIGEGVLVGACSAVKKNVAPHRIVHGNPARDIGPTSIVRLQDGSGRKAYPWYTHFHRGYPEEIVTQWLTLVL